jgi:hypothetical protein
MVPFLYAHNNINHHFRTFKLFKLHFLVMFIYCLQGTDGFGFPMLQDIYTLMMSPEQRQKG